MSFVNSDIIDINSRLKPICFTLVALLLTVNAGHAAANEQENTVLTISPNQCVAIRQGQTCYADVKLTWQTQNKGSYCLYSTQQKKPLQCWQLANNGNYQKEIVANKNVIFQLRTETTERVLTSATLEMAWVYKKNARSHAWRMF